ncbi:MAG: hypothetical protein RIT02_2040 [Planctomycetota bacterium]
MIRCGVGEVCGESDTGAGVAIGELVERVDAAEEGGCEDSLCEGRLVAGVSHGGEEPADVLG